MDPATPAVAAARLRSSGAAVLLVTGILLLLSVLSGAGRAAASGVNTDVHLVNGAPNPAEITIDEGDIVTFVNDDDVAHAIFAVGEQRGDAIPPHERSAPYGPFETGGQAASFPYTVDRNGAPGSINVRGTEASSSSTTSTTVATTSSPSSSASPTTSSASASTTPTTSTTSTTSTSSSSRSTGASASSSSSRASSSPGVTVRDDNSSNTPIFTVLGIALISAGVGGLVFGALRSAQNRRPPSRGAT